MSAITIITQAFGEDANLYTTVLGINRKDNEEVSASQLRKAYYRRALMFHPDKQKNKSKEEEEDTKLKFQAVSLAYSILSDEDKKKEYDECGEMNDMDDDDAFEGHSTGTDAWKEFFSATFGKVTAADIDKFTESYKCSEEEEKDVLKYYLMFKGNLDKMLECVMCSDIVDKQRWAKDYIQPAIDHGTVKDFSEELLRTLSNTSKKAKSKASKKAKSKKGTRTSKKVKTKSVQGSSTGCEDSMEEKTSPQSESDASFDTETDEEKTETEEDSDSPGSKNYNVKDTKTTSSKKQSKPMSKDSSSQSQKSKRQMKNKTVASRKKKQKLETDDDLIAAIRGNAVARRQDNFSDLMSGLEQRYATKSKKIKELNYDIPDDEFEKIQTRLLKKK
mmetsp:Transcript_18451/g.22595  ORF Transcript_18451/g.22595 Transcript_18451/m.22595 type:complete len:389 (+) Transcript_18451:33-1199(+)